MRQCITTLLLVAMLVSLATSSSYPSQAQGRARPAGWEDSSHSNSADPDYAVVFPQGAVNTILLTISPETWQIMLDDMTTWYGEFGAAQRGMAQGLRSASDGTSFQNPIWVAVDLEFNGRTWHDIGMRFKGNSSLISPWRRGIYKLPFRLNFDYFEDDYPQIHNQRFYGFKKLSFTNHWRDDSLLREKVAADLFREAGVPAAQTAFYAVYVDHGDGPIYFGLYTAVEVIDDTVIETQFADGSGNLYKPEGIGATFQAGAFSEQSFQNMTHENTDDYSDILALFDALHAPERLTDPELWRDNLEAIFYVEGFIQWLAINTVMPNWDTYGAIPHNYFLYHDPTTDLLTWLPWDLDLAIQNPPGVNPDAPSDRIGSRKLIFIDQRHISDNWPLIRYLIDDPVYQEMYVNHVADTASNIFYPEKMAATFQAWHSLIRPYVLAEMPGYTHLTSADAFDQALIDLIDHASQRHALAQDYLSQHEGSRQP